MDKNECVHVPQLQTFMWTRIYRNSMYYSINEYIVATDECLALIDHAAPVHDL